LICKKESFNNFIIKKKKNKNKNKKKINNIISRI